jgi:hypothetical protein
MKPNSTYLLQISSFSALIPGRSGEEMKDSVHTVKCSSIKKLLQKYKVFVFTFMIANLFFAQYGLGQGSQTFNTAGTFTFTVPAGVTSITVSAWGGGGAGGGVVGQTKGGGGGEGGSFVRGTISVTPGTPYTVVVGSGGTGNSGNGTNGGASSFGGSGLFNAIGGAGGAVGNSFGNGGSATNTGNAVSGTSTSDFYGGNGGTATNASSASSGGGGGSAGAGGAGGNGGSPLTAGTAGAAGSPPAPGAAGAVGRGSQNDGNGNAGAAPGGGGSGARNANNGTTFNGGTGGNGQIIVTWTCPSATISYPSLPSAFCNSNTSSITPIITGSLGGAFSAAVGLSIDGSTGVISPNTSTTGTYLVHYQIASSNGCSEVNATTSVTIYESPTASVIAQSDITCFAGNDGSITIQASGGTAPYSYSVDGGTTTWISSALNPYPYGGLIANTPYRIKVKDINGCISK